MNSLTGVESQVQVLVHRPYVMLISHELDIFVNKTICKKSVNMVRIIAFIVCLSSSGFDTVCPRSFFNFSSSVLLRQISSNGRYQRLI